MSLFHNGTVKFIQNLWLHDMIRLLTRAGLHDKRLFACLKILSSFLSYSH